MAIRLAGRIFGLAFALMLAVSIPVAAAEYEPDYSEEAPLGESGETSAGGSETEGTMVTEIEVLNTVTTTPEQIRYRMSTRVGHPLRERTLDGDFQRLAAMGVFDDIQIKKELANGGVKIIVAVREKDIIRRIEFRGDRQVRTRKLQDLIESKVGERFDAGKGNRDKRAIEDFYHNEFYYFAEVDVKAEPFEDGVRLVFDVNEGGRLYVAEISFRGNTVFTRKELLAKMETKRSSLISRGKYIRRNFERDLERIRMSYLDKGHLDAKVIERPFEITSNTPTSRWQRRDAYIHIDIEEGDKYYVGRVDINFQGSSLVPEEKIRALIETRPGEVYSPLKIQDDANKIRDVYGLFPNSRYFTKVSPEPEVTEDGAVMDVTFHIAESPEVTVEGVRVTGLTHTKEVVVLREFDLFPGQKMDSRKFNRSKENITNLGYFKDPPTIEVREGSASDRAVLVAEVEEIPTGKLMAGVGVSSANSLSASVGVTQRNFDYKDWPKSFKDLYTGKSFRGGGQNFSLNAMAGTDSSSYTLNFSNPWIFGKPISLNLNAFYNTFEYDEYDETRYGAAIGFGKRLFDIKELTASVAYRAEIVKLQDFAYWISEDLKQEEGSHNVSRWILGAQWDSRDNVYEPTRGLLASATAELAGSASGASRNFWRGFLSGQYFIPFYKDKQERNWTIGIRGDLSVANAYGGDDGVPFYERFYGGGIGTVRGFEYRGISPRTALPDDPNNPYYIGDRVGGEGMASMTVEAFVPVWERLIKASVFFDMGSVWRFYDDPDSDREYRPGYRAPGIRQVPTEFMGQYYSVPQFDPGGPLDPRRVYKDGSRSWRASWGFGLHIKTPLGPLPVRLYYAFPINKQDSDNIQRFQFSMGAMF